MKTTRNLLLAGIIAVFCVSIGNAQVSYSNSLYGATTIYSNDFTSGASVSIEGVAPTVANDFAGGSSGALWNVVSNNVGVGAWMNQDGFIGRIQNSVLLPFTPVSGYVYTLSASLTFTSDPANWLSLGFAANNPADSAAPRLSDSAVNGNPWSLFRPGTGNGGVQLYYSRTVLAANAQAALIPTTYPSMNALSIVLDTTSANWVLCEYANGVLVQNIIYTYSGNPTIHSIGFGQTTLASDAASAGHQWLSLSLAASPLVITKQPVSATAAAGTAFTNTVMVAATAPAYQWYNNDIAISGATNASLILDPVTIGDASTDYYVVITNSLGGAATSAPVSLAVISAPTITDSHPVTYTNPITLYGGTTVGGTNYPGSSPSFSVSAIGQEPLYYQWKTNGVAVAGATNTSFSFTNCPLAGPTSFTCVVTNVGGSASKTWSVSYLPSPAVLFPKTVLEYNPVGFWRLNEGPDDGNGDNGVIASDYMSGNNGIYTNAVLGYSGYPVAPDSTESAARFNYFGIPSDVYGIQGIDFAASAGTSKTFSIQAWANASVGQISGAAIIAKGYNGGEQFALDINGNKYRFVVRNATGTPSTVTAPTGPDGNWHFLVGVCDEVNGVVTLYIDGRIAGSTTIASASGVFASATPVSMGARGSSVSTSDDLQLDGFLSDLAIYNYALSNTQVALLYKAAGYPLEFGFVSPLPPTNAVFLRGGTLTIPATVFGDAPIGYYWTNITTGGVMGTGGSLLPGNLDATLVVLNASASLSGDLLELVVTNTTDSTNWLTTLFTPAPPVTLDYSSPILYSNYFNGGTWSVQGMPLTAANSLVGGTNTTWDVVTNNAAAGYVAYGNGTLGPNLNSVLLPFTPHSGYIYTMSASLTFPVAPPGGGWGALGFGANFPPSNGSTSDPRFNSPLVNGQPWALLNYAAQGGGAVLFDTRGHSVGGQANLMSSLNTPYTINFVLDTTGAQWSTALYIDDTLVANVVYTTGNPTISSIGYGQTTTTAGAYQWNSFALTQEAPGGVPPYLLDPLPPTSVTLGAGTPLSLPVTAFGSAPFGYYWVNTNTAIVLGSGTTNNMAPLNANLAVASVPSSWNGNTLALVVTNVYGTNISLVSLTVTNSVNPIPTNIVLSPTGGQLNLSWPGDHIGWQLQSNSVGLLATNAWFTVSGSDSTNQITITPNASQTNVFYRMFLQQP